MPQNLCMSFGKLIEFYKDGTPNDDEKVMEFMKNAKTAIINTTKKQ